MPNTNRILGERAIVLGAGIAGLAAAGVASNYFREVIVVERDKLPAQPQTRAGVPQGQQIHNLLRFGINAFEHIFPGFQDRLTTQGGVKADYGKDMRVFTNGVWHPQRDFGLTTYFQSRPLLEHTIRMALQERPNVTIRDGFGFESFSAAKPGVIDGVICRAPGGTEELLLADLVLDCMGRGSHSTEMMGKTGHGDVETQRIGIQLVYATAFFRKSPEQQGKQDGFLISNHFPDTRFGALLPIENEGYLCTLGGQFSEHPPRDMEGFMAFTRALAQPEIYETIKDLEVMQPVKAYRLPQAFWHRYDKLAHFPEGFLPLGDSVAGYNPALGQGMSMATKYAMILDELLAGRAKTGGGLKNLHTEYFPRIAAAAQSAWESAIPVNLAHPEATGDRPADLMQRLLFMKGIGLLSLEDEEVHRLVLRVRHFLEPPGVLLREDIVTRAMALAV